MHLCYMARDPKIKIIRNKIIMIVIPDKASPPNVTDLPRPHWSP